MNPCTVCCHETRNAIMAVAYLSKQVQKANPSNDSHLLEAAIKRLDAAQKRCAEPITLDPAITRRPQFLSGAGA